MIRLGDVTATCARWFSSYSFLETALIIGAIAEIYIYAGLSIYFYCLSGSVDSSSRLSICHYNYIALTRFTELMNCFNLIMRGLCSAIWLYDFVRRMKKARQKRQRPELKSTDLLQFAGDILYTKSEIDSLVVQNEGLMDMSEKLADQTEKLVIEYTDLVMEQRSLEVELLKWTMKASDLAHYMEIKENYQTGEEISPLETTQRQPFVEELERLASKLSDLVSKQVDFEETKRTQRVEVDNLLAKISEEAHPRKERDKIEIEKQKLEQERQNLEAEKEALKAKAKKLGIEEERLRTTTPEAFQQLADIQEKFYDDWNILHEETKTPVDGKTAQEIMKQTREFRVKTKETLMLMNENDKLLEDAWTILDSMDCVTLVIQENANWCYYWMKTVAGLFADHIAEDELREAEGRHPGDADDGQVNKGTQEQPEVKEVLLDEARSQKTEVLQVGDGLQ